MTSWLKLALERAACPAPATMLDSSPSPEEAEIEVARDAELLAAPDAVRALLAAAVCDTPAAPALVEAFVALVEAAEALVPAAVAEVAALVALVDAAEAEPPAAVAELAALVAEVLAEFAEPVALDALVAA